MAITIKQRNGKWLLHIQEEWEYNTLDELKYAIYTALENKDRYGNTTLFKEKHEE